MNCSYCGKKVHRSSISMVTGKRYCASSKCVTLAKAEAGAINDEFRKEMDRPIVITEIKNVGDIEKIMFPIVGALLRAGLYRHPILTPKSSLALIYHSVRDVFIDCLPSEYIKTWRVGLSVPFGQNQRFKILKPIPKAVVIETLYQIGITVKINGTSCHQSEFDDRLEGQAPIPKTNGGK